MRPRNPSYRSSYITNAQIRPRGAALLLCAVAAYGLVRIDKVELRRDIVFFHILEHYQRLDGKWRCWARVAATGLSPVHIGAAGIIQIHNVRSARQVILACERRASTHDEEQCTDGEITMPVGG